MEAAVIPLEVATKIIHDTVQNTYTPVTILDALSVELKKVTLTYMYGGSNSDVIYEFILGQQQRGAQEYLIDFLYEIYYHILAYGISEDVFNNIDGSIREFILQSELSDPIKDMTNSEHREKIDILYGVLVFLRLFVRQLDNEIVIRTNAELVTNLKKGN